MTSGFSEPGTVEVAPGVYAYLQPGVGWFVNNASFLVGKKEVVVIDSLASLRRTEGFLQEIRKVTDLPIRYLVNTHAHPDHIWTNHLFRPALTLCHSKCWEETVRGGRWIRTFTLPSFPIWKWKEWGHPHKTSPLKTTSLSVKKQRRVRGR